MCGRSLSITLISLYGRMCLPILMNLDQRLLELWWKIFWLTFLRHGIYTHQRGYILYYLCFINLMYCTTGSRAWRQFKTSVKFLKRKPMFFVQTDATLVNEHFNSPKGRQDRQKDNMYRDKNEYSKILFKYSKIQ